MEYRESKFELGMRSIVGFIIGIGFLVLLFFLMRGIFNILALVAPFLIIIALLVNYRTVTNFLKWLWRLLGNNPIMGILAAVLVVIGYPVVCGFLFAKSFLDRRVRQIVEAQEPREEFIDFEDVTDEETLDLGRLETREELKRRRE